jgi:uncharacterized protein (DUF697 family)
MDPTPAIFELKLRNQAAEAVIKTFAVEHATVDFVTGTAAGLSPVPGTNLVAVAAQLGYSAARIFPAMIKKLAVIYGSEPDEFTRRVVRNGLIVEAGVASLLASAGPEILGHLAIDLVNEFGSEFFQEIALELLGEGGVAVVGSAIPVIGVAFGGVADLMLGATLTWRVGAVVSAYFQYGGYIGSRKETYELTKKHVSRSTRMKRPGTLDAVGTIDPIRKKHEDYVRVQFRTLSGSLSKRDIRDILVNRQHIPADIVDAVAREF